MHLVVAALHAEQQQAVAQLAVAAAATATNLFLPSPVQLIDVEHLDEVAWDAQDRLEAGLGSEAEYLVAFRRARAASAALLVEQNADPQEALYEALHALPPDGFKAAWVSQR